MDYIKIPHEIEDKSMDIIQNLIGQVSENPVEQAIIKRVVHTTGDPDYAKIVKISSTAVEMGQLALKNGCNIITDVNIVKAGISQKTLTKLGGQVICNLNEEKTINYAKESGMTRSMSAFIAHKEVLAGSIIAIGNAPTALFKILEIVEEEPNLMPSLIIGTPVGFVGAAESKELLTTKNIPYVTIEGNKGGSTVAAAIVNALLYSTVER